MRRKERSSRRNHRKTGFDTLNDVAFTNVEKFFHWNLLSGKNTVSLLHSRDSCRLSGENALKLQYARLELGNLGRRLVELTRGGGDVVCLGVGCSRGKSVFACLSYSCF